MPASSNSRPPVFEASVMPSVDQVRGSVPWPHLDRGVLICPSGKTPSTAPPCSSIRLEPPETKGRTESVWPRARLPASGRCDPTVNGFNATSNYVHDQDGNQLTEMDGGAENWKHTNVYANGMLMATDDTTETHFYLNDWLGTGRSDQFCGRRRETCSSLPFGDAETCGPVPNKQRDTGKERDVEADWITLTRILLQQHGKVHVAGLECEGRADSIRQAP